MDKDTDNRIIIYVDMYLTKYIFLNGIQHGLIAQDMNMKRIIATIRWELISTKPLDTDHIIHSIFERREEEEKKKHLKSFAKSLAFMEKSPFPFVDILKGLSHRHSD